MSTCTRCRNGLALARLQAKHARFAEETNRIITDLHNEVITLRAELENRKETTR